jgi:adenylate kinase family enzyme
MQVYNEKTSPIIEYYEKQGKLVRVSGDEETEDLLKIVAKILNDGKQSNKAKNTAGN